MIIPVLFVLDAKSESISRRDYKMIGKGLYTAPRATTVFGVISRRRAKND